MEKKRDSFFLLNKNGQQKKKEGKQLKKEEFKKNRWDNFNKNRVGVEVNQNGDSHEDKPEKSEKKPFDKKTYRLKKYSKKYKLEQWEEQRKKKMVREYQKTLKKDSMAGSYKPVSFDEDTIDSQDVGRFVRHPDIIQKLELSTLDDSQKIKKDPFSKAKEQFNKIKQDKLSKQQEIEKAREEKKKKIEECKKKKHERFKKLSKKTKKGQPVMTGRLELLLEKIQMDKGSK